MPEIVPAQPSDVPAIAALLARAYRDDPIFVHLVPGPDREGWIEREFLVYDDIGARQGWLWTTPDLDGAAWWQPPGDDPAVEEAETRVRGSVWSEAPDGGARYAAFWDMALGLAPDEPHWYLDHVGVEPRRQGRGIGGALIRHGLTLARGEGLPAWLETMNADNVALYERLGFRVTHQEDAPEGGPHVWFMRADP